MYFRDITGNEVGGFGITDPQDLLFVTDFVLVKQKVTSVSVSFEDESVADYFEDQVEAARVPQQFGRIWLHTHPGDSPEPSCTDENTFARVFGSCDWAIMFIIARDSKTFARLRFNAGPGGAINIPVCVDYNCEFGAADIKAWSQQYKVNVTEDAVFSFGGKKKKTKTNEEDFFGGQDLCAASQYSDQELLAEIDAMDPMERENFMEELSVRSDFWDDETEVFYD